MRSMHMTGKLFQFHIIYLSMNPLKPDARGRTKRDIATVRHLYLDLDHDGARALAAILEDPRLPKPSYVLDTSVGKHQVVWKVAGFNAEDAERLQRAMAAAHGPQPGGHRCDPRTANS